MLETSPAFSVPIWMHLYEKQTLFFPLYVWGVWGVCVCVVFADALILQLGVTFLTFHLVWDKISLLFTTVYTRLAVSRASQVYLITTFYLAVTGCDYRHNYLLYLECKSTQYTAFCSSWKVFVKFQPLPTRKVANAISQTRKESTGMWQTPSPVLWSHKEVLTRSQQPDLAPPGLQNHSHVWNKPLLFL